MHSTGRRPARSASVSRRPDRSSFARYASLRLGMGRHLARHARLFQPSLATAGARVHMHRAPVCAPAALAPVVILLLLAEHGTTMCLVRGFAMLALLHHLAEQLAILGLVVVLVLTNMPAARAMLLLDRASAFCW